MTFYAVVLLMAIKTVPFGEDTNLGDLFRSVGTPTGEIAFCCKRLLFNTKPISYLNQFINSNKPVLKANSP